MHSYDDGYVDCPICFGERVLPLGNVGLKAVCHKCRGRGRRDWVTHLTDGPVKPDGDLLNRITQHNIQQLMILLREEAMKVGFRVDIDLKPDSRFHDSFSYPNRFIGGL